MNKDYNNFNFLPQEQFKFILSWNVLNYYPKNDLREFLSSCWNLLRPGGSMIFSYNDCDYKECVKKFKTGVGSWMNESLIKEVTKDVGLVIKNIHHSYETIHWVECNKPGDLSSTKVSSPIGRIIT
jgi:2-polyprenyl-3-methyl-5-hydroxy-6-metoxy-1,4-benzoquinol methylase